MSGGLRSSLQIFPSAAFLETKEFYERLGFRAVCYMESSQPHICLYRDAVEIILTKSSLERICPNREVHGYGYDAYFIAGNQAELYDEIARGGATIVKELNRTDYGNAEFVFEDNEGRWVAVGRKEGSREVLDLRLSHVALYCDDIGAMERFYTDALALKRVRVFNEGKDDEFFILGRDAFRIELFRKRCDIRNDLGSLKHFAVEIPSMDNALALLKEKDISVEKVIDYSNERGVFKVCFVKDPEGNVMEFMEGYRDRR